MKRMFSTNAALVIVCLSASTVQAHELWFQPSGENAASVRLTFGDSPAPGEAERVAEIAHAKVWGDGMPLEVKRLADGLEAWLPKSRPAVLSAYADRGVVDYQGDSFVIYLAAYAQSKPVKSADALKLGLADDQLRLLLVAGNGGPSLVRATWRGKPAADVVVQVFRGGDPTEVRTDARGEIPCPDVSKGPVSLLAVLMDKTPGKRDGKSFSHTRYKATLALGSEADHETNGAAIGRMSGTGQRNPRCGRPLGGDGLSDGRAGVEGAWASQAQLLPVDRPSLPS